MSQLNQVIEQTVSETSFSGVVFIKLNGNVEFENAYGYADRSNKIPNTIDTRFGIASGTKFLTALGIGKLIDRGELSLTARLCDCVNIDFPPYIRGCHYPPSLNPYLWGLRLLR